MENELRRVVLDARLCLGEEVARFYSDVERSKASYLLPAAAYSAWPLRSTQSWRAPVSSAVAHDGDAVHTRRSIPVGSRLASRKWPYPASSRIEDNEVGAGTRPNDAALTQTKPARRQPGHPMDRLFPREKPLLPQAAPQHPREGAEAARWTRSSSAASEATRVVAIEATLVKARAQYRPHLLLEMAKTIATTSPPARRSRTASW